MLNDNFDEVVYVTEQQLLPLNEQDCTECRAKKDYCRHCRSTGERREQVWLLPIPKTEEGLRALSSTERYSVLVAAQAFSGVKPNESQRFINMTDSEQIKVALDFLDGGWPTEEMRLEPRVSGRRWR